MKEVEILLKNEICVCYVFSLIGYLYIGNVWIVLFNYLFVWYNYGKFIIWIEDIDIKCNIVDGECSQFDNLKWMGLDWDEGLDKGGDFGFYC